MHIVLLGDSTLDNKAYTDGAPPVTAHLAAICGDDTKVTLLAEDGATCRDIPYQLDLLPSGATHIVLSVGGNDAMMDVDVLQEPVSTVREALRELSGRVRTFRSAYRQVLRNTLDTGCDVTVCAVYNGDFGQDADQTAINMALHLWNGEILLAAREAECPAIDLRQVCTEPGDFTRQIEPNAQGGQKIAEAIASSVARRQ